MTNTVAELAMHMRWLYCLVLAGSRRRIGYAGAAAHLARHLSLASLQVFTPLIGHEPSLPDRHEPSADASAQYPMTAPCGMPLRLGRQVSNTARHKTCRGDARRRTAFMSGPANPAVSWTRGFCGATDTAIAGDCESGRFGSLALSMHHARGARAAAEARCLSFCSQCPRCNYVSLSLGNADCSWYESCQMATLRTEVPGYRSAPALPRRARGPDEVRCHMTHGFRMGGLATNDPVLSGLIHGLFAEGNVPPGSIADAGANDGFEACGYAKLAPGRLVHAIDPLPANARWIRTVYAALPNLRTHTGGLGRRTTKVALPPGGMRTAGKQVDASELTREIGAGGGPKVQMWRLDDLLQNESLGFAHFDVEGGELDLLHGAAGIIGRSRPIFTAEVHLDVLPRYTRRLLSFLDGLGYHSYVVHEPCGARSDCRNLLNLPRLHRPRVPGSFRREADPDEWLARSPVLRRAFDAGKLVPAHVAVAQRPWANASRRTRGESGGDMQTRSGEMRIPPGLLGRPYGTDVDRGLFAARAA